MSENCFKQKEKNNGSALQVIALKKLDELLELLTDDQQRSPQSGNVQRLPGLMRIGLITGSSKVLIAL